MNQYIYYNFDEIDREMVLNLSTLNEISPVKQTLIQKGSIVTYYDLFYD